MTPFREIGRAWGSEMTVADKVRVVLAFGFPLGAFSHVLWALSHGDIWYSGPAPSWAPMFWYSVCVVDFAVWWLMLTRPRIGIAAAVATMALALVVNWTQFPTFEFGFNPVLMILTVFGAIVLAAAPWLWASSRWKLSPTSSGHSAG
jgi:hypothetical protein